MELYDHLRKISFLFFGIIGLVHFLTGLLYVNGYFPRTSLLVNRVLFIPFVLASLSYFFSNAKCHLIEYGKTSKIWDYIFLSMGIVIFLSFLTLEFLFSDSSSL